MSEASAEFQPKPDPATGSAPALPASARVPDEEAQPELAVTCLLVALWAPLIVMTLLGVVALALTLVR